MSYLYYSQLSFFLGQLLCIALLPAGLWPDDGICYFGVHGRTALIFIVSLTLTAGLLALGASRLGTSPPLLKYALRITAALIVVVAITPYTGSHLVANLHIWAGFSLFGLQALTVLWLGFLFHKAVLNMLLLFLFVLITGAGLYYFYAPTGYLMQAQLALQVLFFLIINRSIK